MIVTPGSFFASRAEAVPLAEYRNEEKRVSADDQNSALCARICSVTSRLESRVPVRESSDLSGEARCRPPVAPAIPARSRRSANRGRGGSDARPGDAIYRLEAFSNGKLVGSQPLSFTENPPYSARATLAGVVVADELVVSSRTPKAPKPVELIRQAIRLPDIEADAVAIPDHFVNPVDLGTILVPAGWLLLGPKETATLEIAALNRKRDVPASHLKAWFNSLRIATRPVPLCGRANTAHLETTRGPADRRSRHADRHS